MEHEILPNRTDFGEEVWIAMKTLVENGREMEITRRGGTKINIFSFPVLTKFFFIVIISPAYSISPSIILFHYDPSTTLTHGT